MRAVVYGLTARALAPFAPVVLVVCHARSLRRIAEADAEWSVTR